MIIEVMKSVVANVSKRVGYEVRLVHGNTLTIVNEITKLRSMQVVFPCVLLFTEGMTETESKYTTEVKLPKLAIVTTTKINMTENQRLESTFARVINPIFNLLRDELGKIDCSYELSLAKTDIPFFVSNNENDLNALVDGCVIRNVNLTLMNKKKC